MKGVENAPSIILTDVEHQKFTNALAAAWKAQKGGAPADVDKLWQIYKTVYEKEPHWLEAIKHYFPRQH